MKEKNKMNKENVFGMYLGQGYIGGRKIKQLTTDYKIWSETGIVTSEFVFDLSRHDFYDCSLILRPLSKMTEDEHRAYSDIFEEKGTETSLIRFERLLNI
jgi:hypothetical protein